MSAAIARMSSACFKPLHSNTVTLLLFADFPLGKSVFLFFTASLRRFGYPDHPCLLEAFRLRFRPWARGPLDDIDRAIAAGLDADVSEA
mgnify:CR=1 FL=1